jgi:hypothetical protein
MAGTTGLEPATSAVTGQRSNQLSYVPKMFFNNLAKHHIESCVFAASLFSLDSTSSLLWTQVQISLDTNRTPNDPMQRQNQVYQIWCPPFLLAETKVSLAHGLDAKPVAAGLRRSLDLTGWQAANNKKIRDLENPRQGVNQCERSYGAGSLSEHGAMKLSRLMMTKIPHVVG